MKGACEHRAGDDLQCRHRRCGAQRDGVDRLAGHRQGTGDVSGMQATLALSFAPVLEGKAVPSFLQQPHARCRWQGVAVRGGSELFLSRRRDATCRGHWYDTRGMILPLVATAQVDALAVEWGDATTERGRTTYRLDADTLHVTDEVRDKEGQWKVFRRSRLQRSKETTGEDAR
jgi:hypothetical protein